VNPSGSGRSVACHLWTDCQTGKLNLEGGEMSSEVLAAIITGGIALLAVIASLWPSLQGLQRGRKFKRLIKRELAEITPDPEDPDKEKPWWEHATRRFVHEAMFRDLSQNRDFLLSLNPTLVYRVSQLWIALEKRDGNQWGYFLKRLADDRRVGSEGLRKARDKWEAVLKAQRKEWLETMGAPSSFRQEAVLARTQPLFEKRFEAYGELLPLTDYGPENQPKDLGRDERKKLANRLREWFYKGGAGLLLSGRAFEQFQSAREALSNPCASSADIRGELSQLRTDLKIDLGVRQPPERNVAVAWPEDERW
jgi:hypothetical protein